MYQGMKPTASGMCSGSNFSSKLLPDIMKYTAALPPVAQVRYENLPNTFRFFQCQTSKQDSITNQHSGALAVTTEGAET